MKEGDKVDGVRGTEMGGKVVMGVNSWGIRYVSMSQRQQQHRAVQQAVRHVSPVSSLLLSSTTYTEEQRRERSAEKEDNIEKAISDSFSKKKNYKTRENSKNYSMESSAVSSNVTMAAMIFL